jgi:hypothetical protein
VEEYLALERESGERHEYLDGIDSINCTLPLAEVYDRVTFPPEDDLLADDEELKPPEA